MTLKPIRHNVAAVPGVNDNAAHFGHLLALFNRSDGSGMGNPTTEAESALQIPIGGINTYAVTSKLTNERFAEYH